MTDDENEPLIDHADHLVEEKGLKPRIRTRPRRPPRKMGRPKKANAASHDRLRMYLRHEMEERGLTAKRLSVGAGLGATYVADFLSGKVQGTTTESLEKIAGVLGLDPSILAKFIDESHGDTKPSRLRATKSEGAKQAHSRVGNARCPANAGVRGG